MRNPQKGQLLVIVALMIIIISFVSLALFFYFQVWNSFASQAPSPLQYSVPLPPTSPAANPKY